MWIVLTRTHLTFLGKSLDYFFIVYFQFINSFPQILLISLRTLFMGIKVWVTGSSSVIPSTTTTTIYFKIIL